MVREDARRLLRHESQGADIGWGPNRDAVQPQQGEGIDWVTWTQLE